MAQFAPGADSAVNLETICRLTADAVAQGARLVVFPEYSSFFDGAVGESYLNGAEPLDGAFVSGLNALATEHGVGIVAGIVESAEARRFSNTLVAVAPGGTLVGSYRKQHLYDAFGARESDWIVPGPVGAQQAVFHLDGVVIGLQTCFDLRFPEITRVLVDAAAELVVVPAEWVPGRQKTDHWRTLLAARAIENTVFVAAADHIPPAGVGNSGVWDPMGVRIAALGELEGVAVAPVSTQRVHEVREVNPSVQLRRYGVAPI